MKTTKILRITGVSAEIRTEHRYSLSAMMTCEA
jgi:hypothetical protein